MEYYTTDREGITELAPTEHRLRGLLRTVWQRDAFTEADEDAPDVWLTHFHTGWTLFVYPSGLVVLENLDDEDCAVRHLRKVNFDHALYLWQMLLRGDLKKLFAQNWLEGDGNCDEL